MGFNIVDIDGATIDDGGAEPVRSVQIAGSDGTNSYFILVDNTGAVRTDPTGTTTQPVSVVTLPLPTGAATAANQATIIGHVDGIEASLSSIDTKLTDGSQIAIARSGAKGTSTSANITSNPIDANTEALHVDGSNVTQPISAASLPLPSGAATSANQTTIIGHVDGIEGLLTTIDSVLDSIDAKDFATQTTLAAQLNITLSALRDAITGVGPSNTLADLEATLESIKTFLDNEDFASAANQTTIIGHVDGLESLATQIDAVLDTIKDPANTQASTRLRNTGDTAYIGSILNNSIERLETRSSITSPNGATDADVGTLATSNNRLSVASRLTDGVDWLATVVNNSIRRLESRASITSPDGATDADVGTLATSNNRLSVASRLTDGVGFLGSIVTNSIRRLETRAKLVGQVAGAGAEIAVTTIADTENVNQKRLQTEARIAPGSTVNIGTGIPADPSDLSISFLENGGSEDMLVDGSVTPVTFSAGPTGSDILAVQELRLIFTAADFDFDGNSFGPLSALTNGILFETDINGTITPFFTIIRNEDFPRIPGGTPVINNTGPKDILVARFNFGGLLKLNGATNDHVQVIVRDDLTGTQLTYLTVTLFGALE